MQHVEPLRSASFPWRTTTVVVGAIALAELVALIAIGLAQLAPSHTAAAATPRRPAAPAHHAAVRAAPRVPSHPLRPRSRVRVLVLNGNGVSGAAGAEAGRLRGDGYRVAGATNAQRHDYASSMVMFVPGWAKEARRLAHETGIRIVSPVDGLRPAQLRGSKVVILLGS